MAAAAVGNHVNVQAESKSRKKKAKAEAAANGTSPSPTVPETDSKDVSVAAHGEDSGEHPYLKELQKQIRNINKKLSAMQKVDSVVAENPGVSLDDLVAQRKINNDQRAQALKKPQLQAQLADLEERQAHYRSFDAEYQTKFSKQREELTSQHEKALKKIKEEARVAALSSGTDELRKKLLTFSQFLRAAAAKRIVEEDAETPENRAFEGALLLVYGGDSNAVDTAISIIEGAEERVPSIEGEALPVTFAQVKKASIEHAPYGAEEAWVDQVAKATSEAAPEEVGEVAGATSDPTIVNAGLTELQDTTQTNGVPSEILAESSSAAAVSSGDAGNLAGERWDTDAAGTSAGAEKSGLDESYEIVPRPSEEVDIPAEAPVRAAPQPQSTRWADEPTHEAATGAGNQAGESWDLKAPGEAENNWGAEPAQANGWAEQSEAAAAADDGFHEVAGRRGGRGGGRGRGDGEFRGRGRGGFRGHRGGDGEFRGRGGRGGGRGGRGDGEGRGGRGRGRGGPRGGVDGAARPS